MLSNLESFFYMGGYGIYVWPCYMVCVIAFAWHAFRALQNYKNIKKNLIRAYTRKSGD